jgi:hypothetical protein
MAKFVPLVFHHPQPRTCLFAERQAAKGGDNSRITNLLLSGLQQIIIVAEHVSWIPKLDGIFEEFDHCLSGVICIVLMYQ